MLKQVRILMLYNRMISNGDGTGAMMSLVSKAKQKPQDRVELVVHFCASKIVPEQGVRPHTNAEPVCKIWCEFLSSKYSACRMESWPSYVSGSPSWLSTWPCAAHAIT